MRRTVITGGLGLLLLASCNSSDPQILNTYSGEWETPSKTPSPSETGWQCGDRPCSEDELQHLTDTLENLQ